MELRGLGCVGINATNVDAWAPFASDGWELADRASFAEAVASVEACGVSVKVLDAPDRVARGVELSCGPLTDQFAWGPNGAAFIDLPVPSGHGLNHVMVEANTLEDVGCTFDRARAADVPGGRVSWSTTPRGPCARTPAAVSSGVTPESSWTQSRTRRSERQRGRSSFEERTTHEEGICRGA